MSENLIIRKGYKKLEILIKARIKMENIKGHHKEIFKLLTQYLPA